MDTVKCVCFLVIGCLAIGKAKAQPEGASCVQNLAQSEDFQRCTRGFTAMMQEMAMSGSMDPTKMYEAFCSPEGKAALSCLMEFIMQCPEIQAAMSGGGEGQGLDFQDIMKQGGIDVFCELTTSNCRPLMENCMAKMNDSDPMGAGGMNMDKGVSYKGPTPYSPVPLQMSVVCGPMNEMISCVLNAVDQCPSTAAFMEKQLEKMSEKSAEAGGPPMPSFAETKSYVIDVCPTLPDDFASKQQCIMTTLGQTDFTTCYKNVTDNKKTKCDIYFGGSECVMMHVGKACGKPYAEALVDASPLFTTVIPGNCKPSTGGVSNLQASIITIIFTGILCLLGWF